MADNEYISKRYGIDMAAPFYGHGFSDDNW